jgi:hypothetical protein
MSTRSTLRRAAALIAGAVIGSTLLIHGAEAMAPRDGQSARAAVVAPKSAGLPATTRQAGTRCFGQTDNPHNSRHFPGDVSVSSRTVCPGHAVTVVVSLYKRVHGSWRLLDTGRNSGAGRTQANAHGRCGRRGSTHRFLGIGYHTATGHTAAATRNAKRVTCR